MGVSHPALEAIRSKTGTYNLQTKLTGAGGGGCAVTLVPDGTFQASFCYKVRSLNGRLHLLLDNICSPVLFDSGFSDEKLKQLMGELRLDGFEPYLTSVGGSGVGILSPHAVPDGPQHFAAYSVPVTPPETPGSAAVESEEIPPSSLRVGFENTATIDFTKWADQRGRWLYV